ncbi:MAG: precorrin-3B C(17)-methyltransferase [Lachnospiraceae bacterium]|nr:precorrin-3B C(17)-methyltransferase [Lachnospiraceae bacterium]
MKKIYVVGIGPGEERYMTFQAREALEDSDIICGYTVYVDLVKPVFPDKEYYSTGMMKEKDRCQWVVDKAGEGNTVALVCSGDAGVYGMAGLVFELAQDRTDIEIEVVSGITAALSGAAVLGAPVGHDFCVVSLSDHLTPWELIEKRIRLAAEGDFIICIYNPKSKLRQDYLKMACDIVAEVQGEDLVCGWVKNIGREGQEYGIVPLKELADEPVDMFTTVFIGSSKTVELNGRMVTPRGYIEKYGK